MLNYDLYTAPETGWRHLYVPLFDDSFTSPCRAARAAFNEIDRIEQLLSRYVENSDICRINSLGRETPVAVYGFTKGSDFDIINIDGGRFAVDVALASLALRAPSPRVG